MRLSPMCWELSEIDTIERCRGFDVREAPHPKRVGETKKSGNGGDQERELEGAVAGLGVDGEDSVLDVLGLVRDLLLELGVAHDLCVGSISVAICCCWAGGITCSNSQIGEAHRQNPEHDPAGQSQSERQAERARGGVHPGGFADPLLSDGRQGEVVELGDEQPQPRAGDEQRDHEVPARAHSRHQRDDGGNADRAQGEAGQHDVGRAALARFAAGQECHAEHGERERRQGKSGLHGVVLQRHLQEERQGDHGAAQGDLLEHLLGDADPEVQVLEQVGVQQGGFPATFTLDEPVGERGQRDGADGDDEADIAAALLPDQDAEDDATHADTERTAPTKSILRGPVYGTSLTRRIWDNTTRMMTTSSPNPTRHDR